MNTLWGDKIQRVENAVRELGLDAGTDVSWDGDRFLVRVRSNQHGEITLSMEDLSDNLKTVKDIVVRIKQRWNIK